MNRALKRIIETVNEMKDPEKPLLIGIDGRCAAGKTTLAKMLEDEIGCSVIHMDHFFLPAELRTKERLDAPGGNFDIERFISEVYQPLKDGKDAFYRVFDCKTMSFVETVKIACRGVVVVEGAYSCHPEISDCYRLTVFLTVDEEEQAKRIIKRNGQKSFEVFKNKWIPLEEKYFSTFGIEENCHLVFRSTL